MARNFNELRAKMSPERLERNRAATKKMLEELPLAELREAQKITQEQLAKRLKVGQDAISKIEHRADMYVSTLANVIRGMGGRLELIARFDSGDVRIAALTRRTARKSRRANRPRR